MVLSKHVILAGFMGAGKSTLGRKLARKWNVPFYDLDYRIEQSEQMSIPKIFEHHGERYFRNVEAEELKQLEQLSPGIVALGGGALHSDETIQFLKQIGRLIYLKVSFTELMHRIGKSDRPLVKKKEDLKLRFDERQQYYQQADIILTIDKDESVDFTLNRIEEQLSQ